MKISLSIIFLCLLSTVLSAGIVIKGIDFQKSESIAAILKGVNLVRGTQDVVLALDETRRLIIVDSSKYQLGSFDFYVGVKGIRSHDGESQLSRNEFTEELKRLTKVAKEGGHNKLYISINFHGDVSGVDGHQILKDICDNGIAGIIFRREENRAERELRLKKERAPKPSDPSSPARKINGSQ